jgi:hypothetical protein
MDDDLVSIGEQRFSRGIPNHSGVGIKKDFPIVFKEMALKFVPPEDSGLARWTLRLPKGDLRLPQLTLVPRQD